jgi:hypothetical protein
MNYGSKMLFLFSTKYGGGLKIGPEAIPLLFS